MRAFSSLLFLAVLPAALAVKQQDFKTCSQAAFCRRGRALSRGRKSPSWRSPYSFLRASSLVAAVKSSLYPDVKFSLDVRVHDDGVVRVRMDEVDGLRKRYDEASSWALVAEPTISPDVKWSVGKKDVRATYVTKKDIEVVVSYDPLTVTLFRAGKPQVVLNGRGLLHLEHFRTKAAGREEDGFWEEKFGSWTDSKPKGAPESLSIDINFPNHGHVYGIPQHATRLDLPTTTGEDAHFSEPYRLYNADVFEYLPDSPMSLYGSIPLMHAHSAEGTVAIFNAVASETWIDVGRPSATSTETHWISESGILDVFIMPGPTPADVFAQYTRLTGTPALPAHWALAYHQCRWNYISSDDVRDVQRRFDAEDMPVDVFWLDIEYAEEHKYFIWDKKTFPDPVDMTHDVEAIGRKMVVIIDPHLKRTDDYPVYKEAKELGVLVKTPGGENNYEGWCWSGSSAWIDFFNPNSWDWWTSLFKIEPGEKWSWTESTIDTYVWNDMNEPAIFNGPEISMPRDNIHHGGWEHRDIHNINGMLLHNLTAQAVTTRTDPPRRPFVLPAIWCMWTGDNLGTWEHMAVGLKMVLANNVGGFSFAGSDVGGFFGNPEPEMLVRWYGRREPYLLDEPYKSILRSFLRLRYSLCPGLLVKPITEKGVTEASVYLPEDQVYYDYFNYEAYRGASKGKHVTVPFLIRGGSIVPTRERPRRSSLLMKRDPFTLRVALDTSGAAKGELYLDDGETFSHRDGKFIWREFIAGKQNKGLLIRSTDLAAQKPGEAVDGVALSTYDGGNDFAKDMATVRVERVVVFGSAKPKSVQYTPGVASNTKKQGTASVLVIKDPGVGVSSDWEIVIQV
ncbi:alpha-glucosidase [Fomitopsis serialis]|uniref:alpha-glucosidase n=1 Tax=Fomitopsis serialis TaxID=139415 RepID=UPI00200827D9|nr:alpha-glucosidase [Neoantrodia serialis]KAH9927835.1 alpha-glucosidase [Neoantrodia serialis]